MDTTQKSSDISTQAQIVIRADGNTAQRIGEAWQAFDVPNKPMLIILPNDDPDPKWLESDAFKKAVGRIIYRIYNRIAEEAEKELR